MGLQAQGYRPSIRTDPNEDSFCWSCRHIARQWAKTMFWNSLEAKNGPLRSICTTIFKSDSLPKGWQVTTNSILLALDPLHFAVALRH